MTDDFVAVYGFQKLFTEEIKIALPFVSKFYYFSDVSSSQYKNFKNFANLCHHMKDFRVDAEWNFFVTSHGKNACDCVGGMLQRLAAKASLQRHLQNQILTQISSFPLRKLWLALKAFLYQKRRFRKYQTS